VVEASPPGSRVARVLETALRSLVELNAMQFPAPGADRLQLGEHAMQIQPLLSRKAALGPIINRASLSNAECGSRILYI
jgi:hypothetical protein